MQTYKWHKCINSQKWTDLNDNDKEDSTGGWILFRSGVISGQKTGNKVSATH